jgi:hypothetical protein
MEKFYNQQMVNATAIPEILLLDEKESVQNRQAGIAHYNDRLHEL